MVVGEVATAADVVVIGGGPAGYTAALEAAARGRSVVLVEADALGGACLHRTCIPTKAILAGRDPAEVIPRLEVGVLGLLGRAGVRVLGGRARFSGPGRVAVETAGAAEHVEFEWAVVAVGSRADPPAGAADAVTAVLAGEVPPVVTLLEGDPWSAEVAEILARRGVKVTIAAPVLPLLPRWIGRAVEAGLNQIGVKVAAEPPAEPAAVLSLRRQPATDDLGLDRAGVELGPAGSVAVDRSMRAAAHVLAAGDCTSAPALASVAMAQARVAAATAAGVRAAYAPLVVPVVVRGTVEVMSVGEIDGARHLRLPGGAAARALMLGPPEAAVEVIADATGTVIGVHGAGRGVAELAGEAALAVEMGATLEDLALTLRPHPSLSEMIGDASRRLSST